MARISRKISPGQKAEVSRPIYNAGIYLRLSVEDARKKASDSIGTQKALVLQYLSRHSDIVLSEIYQDVNYSGTDFDRPGFARMMADAHAGKINCIIVKDLSRFGRNYLEAGTYLEHIFPILKLRFISVNDRYDSFSADKNAQALLVPIKNLMNEVYARDISKKSRSQYAVKRKRGDFCGAFAPYGYIKAGSRLAIDEAAAKVVSQIFACAAQGQTDAAIAQSLNAAGVLPPGRYSWEKGIVKGEKFRCALAWNRSTVARICSNTVYTGNTVGGKYQRALFAKDVPIRHTDNGVIVCPDTHPAIVSPETFAAVQKARKSRRRQAGENLSEAV